MTTLQLVMLVAVGSAIVFAPLCAWLASRRDRSMGTWLVLGAVAGPVAGAVLALAPPGRCPACGATITGWPEACPECGVGFAEDGDRARLAGNGIAAGDADATAAPLAMAGLSGSAASGEGPRSSSRARSATAVTDGGAETVMLATALFVSGSRDCEAGMHYLIAVRGDKLVVLGPLETSPHNVASARRLETLMVTAFGQRLLISEAARAMGWSLAFQDLSGGTPESVERALLERGVQSGVG